MNRHSFIEATSYGVLPTGALSSVSRAATKSHPPISGPLGILYDSTLYVGCQAYAAKCQDINLPKRNPQGERTWSGNDKLSPYTNNITQVWTNDTGVNKDQEENGYTYIKEWCMHCVDPNCVSMCPVSALKGDPRTGIVHYDKNAYTDYRYCMAACPYNMPKYDHNNPLGTLHKCELCDQKSVKRLDKGGLPGCIEVCPAGAMIFGTREELMARVKKRPALKPGSEYHYPRQTLKSGDTYLCTVPRYCPHLYGEEEGGGIQALVLTGMPYKNLNLPRLSDLSTGARSEHVQHTLYRGMMLPLAALAGLTVLVRHNTKNDHHGREDDYES